jgi:hypothetical protein
VSSFFFQGLSQFGDTDEERRTTFFDEWKTFCEAKGINTENHTKIIGGRSGLLHSSFFFVPLY